MFVRFDPSDVETLTKMFVEFNSDIAIDMNLKNGIRTAPDMLKLGWVEDSLHDLATDNVVEAVAFGVASLVVSVDTALTAVVD